jgi:hypothetical protein
LIIPSWNRGDDNSIFLRGLDDLSGILNQLRRDNFFRLHYSLHIAAICDQSILEATSQKLLKERSDNLKGVNKEQMDNITKPFFKEMEELRKMIGENRPQNNSTAI